MKQQSLESRFRCPKCRGKLKKTTAGFSCANCMHTFPLRDGIPLLLPTVLPYADEAAILPVIDAMKQGIPWRKAAYELLADPHPHLYQIITNEARASWHLLFDLEMRQRVLDIGAGHGMLAISMARRTHVVALDASWPHLEFLNLRAREDNISTLSIVGGDSLALPFHEKIFDLVMMSGVLEWIPRSHQDISPREAQVQALRECRRVVKPGGQLCIGIENSHGMRYYLGHPDDHTGIPHISYLPREKADRITRTLLGISYRTYTYTAEEYRNLFMEAGFHASAISFSIPIPDYNSMDIVLPANRPEMAMMTEFIVDRPFHRMGDMNRINAWGIDVSSLAHANAYLITATA